MPAFDPERLQRIESAVTAHIGPKKLAGAITLLAHRGEIMHRFAAGMLDVERNKVIRHDSLFRLYSMTKPIICVALMMLFEEGKVRLSDPAERFLPAFKHIRVLGADGALEPPRRPVMVRDLLNHTSGITYHWLEYGEAEQRYRDANLFVWDSLAAHVDTLLSLPLAFHPGAQFRYGESHDVVARLIEVIAQMPLDQFLQQRLFDPLRMTDTGFWVRAENLPRFSAMYGSREVLRADTTISNWYGDAMRGGHQLLADPLDCLHSQPHQAFRGGHGLVSSIDDYFNFCRMLLNGGEFEGRRLLGRKTIELMTANTLPAHQVPYEIGGVSSPGYGIGLGMRVMLDPGAGPLLGSPGEFGWGGAASTYFWIDPREAMIGISMAQYQPNGLYPLGLDFRNAAYQALI